tara:strand:+ start:3457 stop:4656 length:1200 start_codon:yes stop_codon:yes gene_type:complete
MHVFIITQYFPPEIGAAASRWGDYVNILINQGYKITVLSEAPHYPHKNYYSQYKNHWLKVEKKSPNLTILRSKAFASSRKGFVKKIIHYSVFMISGIINSRLVKNYDLLIISSPPLFTGIIGLYIRYFRKKEYFLDIRDLWPDSALELDQIKRGFIYKLGKKLELKIYNSAKGFIIPVPGFKSYFKNLSHEISKKPMFELINGISDDFLKESFSIETKPDKKFTVLYSGNIGLAQDLKTIINSAEILKNYDIYFKFIGEGVCREEIEFLSKPLSDKIDLLRPLPRKELIKHIKKASLCLVPLKDKKLFESALPSKMFEYMACGKPIIVSIKGDAERIVRDSKAGMVVEPENAKLLSEAILKYYLNKDRCNFEGKNGMTYVTKKLSKELLISNLMNEIKK